MENKSIILDGVTKIIQNIENAIIYGLFLIKSLELLQNSFFVQFFKEIFGFLFFLYLDFETSTTADPACLTTGLRSDETDYI